MVAKAAAQRSEDLHLREEDPAASPEGSPLAEAPPRASPQTEGQAAREERARALTERAKPLLTKAVASPRSLLLIDKVKAREEAADPEDKAKLEKLVQVQTERAPPRAEERAKAGRAKAAERAKAERVLARVDRAKVDRANQVADPQSKLRAREKLPSSVA